MEQESFPVKIGLALSGGTARGIAHLGVLQSLEDHKIRPDCIAGTSIGALVAAFYAFKMPVEKMRMIAEKMRWMDVTSFKLSRLGLLSNEEIGELVEKELGSVMIENAAVPLAVIATDIATGEKVVFRSGDVAAAVMASTCIPGIFKPAKVDERMMVDGMMVENVPISPLKEMGAEVIIAVNLGSEREYRSPDDLIDVVLNSFYIAVDRATQHDLAEADVLIEPKVAEFRRSDLKKAAELFSKGYREATLKIDSIHNAIDEKSKQKSHPISRRFKRLLPFF